MEELCMDYLLAPLAKDEELAELSVSLEKLETVILKIDARQEDLKTYATLLDCILRGAPLLKTIEVLMYYDFDDSERKNDLGFANGFIQLQRLFPQVKMSSESIDF
ncbi:uncharacterized protein LOC131072570 [Cryptomeria japonica]|uniref:uncharacterized protein LOC131072570 n=1 Tax=Cryptomeria japonica TaxID=3369 RepID=UPI0025ABC62B|nr:uncharacterized protein LOC131072570 [Cryptomeria japonica]